MGGTGWAWRTKVPWVMAGYRALLCPVMLLGQRTGWDGTALAGLVVSALLSDIFDGVLARHWHCDTGPLRLFDSIADAIFYLGVAGALSMRHPDLLRRMEAPLAAVAALEVARLGLELVRFGKPASYHSVLAKTWGLTLAAGAVLGFVGGSAPLLTGSWRIAAWVGVACDLEGLAISLALPVWRKDVLSLWHALRLRATILQDRSIGNATRVRGSQGSAAAGLALAILLLSLAVARAEPIHPVVVTGLSSTALASGTEGELDVSSADVLVFRAAGNRELRIPYGQVRDFSYRREVRHHLGVLPAIAVGLIAARQHRYLTTVDYVDSAGTRQVTVFEVPKDAISVLVPLLRQRTPVCEAKPKPVCTGTPHWELTW